MSEEKQDSHMVPTAIELAMQGKSPWLEARGKRVEAFHPKSEKELPQVKHRENEPKETEIPATVQQEPIVPAGLTPVTEPSIPSKPTSDIKKVFPKVATAGLGIVSAGSLTLSAISFSQFLTYAEGNILSALSRAAISSPGGLLFTGLVSAGLSFYFSRKK